MKEPKQIVCRYNGDEKSDEVEQDLDGEVDVPQKGHIITRKGKQWKVVHMVKEETVAGPKAIPVYRLFLSDRA